jgi:hypothetical protein
MRKACWFMRADRGRLEAQIDRRSAIIGAAMPFHLDQTEREAPMALVLPRWYSRPRPIALVLALVSAMTLAACGPAFTPGYAPYNNYRSGGGY